MDEKRFSRPLDLKTVRITDAFWGREQELVRTEVIPYQWEALNDRVEGAAPSYCMHNFRAAGRLVKAKKTGGASFQAPSYTYRGFETLPEDPAHPDPDTFYGFVFQDSDFSKWIEAVGYTLAQHPDPELERIADEAIETVCAAQWENGYLDTYYIINGMDKAFTNLKDHHELYCLGHLTEGAVAYYQATGKDKLLKAACGYADYACSCFGPEEGKKKGYPGHEIAEMALVRLYEVTGCERYLKLAEFFLDARGTEPHYFIEEERKRDPEAKLRKMKAADYAYYQAHQPVRLQSEAVGHAVRAGYLYSGMADVARLRGDEEMLSACERLWASIVNEKLYITGGVGGTNHGEAFSYPYDLPNDLAYSETCAAIALVFFARRMLQIRPAGGYADVMELALYNTVLAGMALDGKSFFYVNPLEVFPEACHKDGRRGHVQPVRQKWFGCACCPPNLARLVSSVGEYAYTENGDTLWTHLYMGSQASVRAGDRRLCLQMETGMPWNGHAMMTVRTGDAAGTVLDGATIGIPYTLAFRIPGWSLDRTDAQGAAGRTRAPGEADRVCGSAEIVCGGRRQEVSWTVKGLTEPSAVENVAIRDGYLYVTGAWRDGDFVCLNFAMEVRMVAANTRVREDIGRVAFTRGPVTFCMEEADNGKELWLCRVDPKRIMAGTDENGGVRVEMSEALGHPMAVLKVPAVREQPQEQGLYHVYTAPEEMRTTLTLIPYYAWANRGEGEMSVWIRI